jgi:hypothetical protein
VTQPEDVCDIHYEATHFATFLCTETELSSRDRTIPSLSVFALFALLWLTKAGNVANTLAHNNQQQQEDSKTGSTGIMAPPNKKRKTTAPANKKKRKTISGKKRKPAEVEGVEFRVYRIPDETDSDVFVPAPPNAPGKLIDSFVHRYGRSVGFKVSDKEEKDIERNELMRDAHEKSNEVIDKINNAINSQSLFECFVLKHLRNTNYGEWLITVSSAFGSDGLPTNVGRQNPISFLAPCKTTVAAWAEHLHKKPHANGAPSDVGKPTGRSCCAKTIETYLGGLSTTTKQVGHHKEYLKMFKSKLDKWRDDEKEADNSAPLFSVGEDLNALYIAIFESKIGWSYEKKLELWTAVLCQCNIIGRASDVTTYCPVWEDVKYPKEMDADGLPAWIVVKLRNWKWRKSKKRGGKPLEFMIKRNYLNASFCFVTNFVLMTNVFLDHGEDCTKGPIFGNTFGNKNSKKYAAAVKRMFVVASRIPGHEHLKHCSSHSIRRTFAQWADTCGYDPFSIMELGRWSDVPTLRIYVDANRNAQKRMLMLDSTYQNPGFNVWLFETEVFVG